MSAYFKDQSRPVIQVERREKGNWIVWNWDTARWDARAGRLTMIARCNKCGTDYTPGDMRSFCPHERINANV
jgi:uncharacterized OB-fold protein